MTTSVGIRFLITSATRIRVTTAEMIATVVIEIMAEVVVAPVVAATMAADAVAETVEDEMVEDEMVEVAMVTVVVAMATTRIGAASHECHEKISATVQWDGPLLKSQLPGAWLNQNL